MEKVGTDKNLSLLQPWADENAIQEHNRNDLLKDNWVTSFAEYIRLHANGSSMETDKSMKEAKSILEKVVKGELTIRFSDRGKQQNTQCHERDWREYIMSEEPINQEGIITINGITVLSEGNVLTVQGLSKSRKTLFACYLVNESKLKTAYIDTEQGPKHSWKLKTVLKKADVFRLRGEECKEIIRVLLKIIESNDYQLVVIDNVRDLIKDFNKPEESANLDLLLKQISNKCPCIAIIHTNKTSVEMSQGHLGYGLSKMSQTIINVSLLDTENPAKGSEIKCLQSRDEPFSKCVLNMDGSLSSDVIITGKKKKSYIDQDAFLKKLGTEKHPTQSFYKLIADFCGIASSSARNKWRDIKPYFKGKIIEDGSSGKSKFFYVNPA